MGSNLASFKLTRRPAILLVILVTTIAALLYLNFQSISLDDFDSVSFALALNHFDIGLQQPQPPGFPIYVAMGDLAHSIYPEAKTALTIVSVVAGAVGVGAMLWFGTEIGNLTSGLLAAL